MKWKVDEIICNALDLYTKRIYEIKIFPLQALLHTRACHYIEWKNKMIHSMRK